MTAERPPHPDGTWRFTSSDAWDTTLMTRVFRGEPVFDHHSLPRAVAFLPGHRIPTASGRSASLDDIPLRRSAHPEEAARLITCLASGEAARLTGGDHVVDGGYQAK